MTSEGTASLGGDVLATEHFKMPGSETDGAVSAAVTLLSLDTSCGGVETLFRDGLSIATSTLTGILASPHAFEYIIESAFSMSAPEPAVELSSSFVGVL